MKNEILRGYWASGHFNDDFICVATMSGYRGGTHADPKGIENFISVDASDQDLGSAVVDALAHSRWVLTAPREGFIYPPEVEFDAIFTFEKNAERYAAWVEMLMKRYGYKTKKSLFKNMKYCSIEKKSGFINFQPFRHEKLEGWSGLGEKIIISDASSVTEIGATLRLTLSRCTG